MAGKGKGIENFKKSIIETAEQLHKSFEFYITKAVGDAETFVRSKCMIMTEPTVYIACGGDGTFNEVLNGAFGFENACVGVIPTGTGNDFCRNFKDCDFSDIKATFNGTPANVDVIQYSSIVKGKKISKYCANMFNIGFDCNVADTTATLKKYPLIKGSLAYFLSILLMIIKKKGADIKIEIDGKETHNGKVLLTSIANGCFCGGGIKSNPYAKTTDGLIDVNIIKNIPRYLFIPCLPKYMKGTLFENDKYAHIASTLQCKSITVTPNKKMRLCVDGEIFDAEKVEFNIVPSGINLLKPNNNNNYYQNKKGEEKMKKILFQGDSITDCARNREDDRFMGRGYATNVAQSLGFDYPGEYEFVNKGISGNRIVDLYARMKIDLINLKPDYMSVLIGINDVWHEIARENGVAAEKFEKIYDMLISEVLEELPNIKIMILEPYVLKGTATEEN